MLAGLTACVLLIAAVAAPAAASTPDKTTFAGVIAASKLIVLVEIDDQANGGVSLKVERVFKGVAPAQLVYPALLTTPPFAGWARAVIAFADPATDDFRAPTIAWHVASDGAIDPENFQRYPGLPLTLAAMLEYFGAPATSTAPAPDPAAPGPSDAPLGVAVFAIAAFLLYRARWFGGRVR